MFRKLIVVFCLISFAPAAVSAQGLVPVAAPQAAVVPATEKAPPPGGELNLSLPAERSAAVLLAAAETSQAVAMENAPEQKRESRRSHSWDNFLDVHFGGYRWIWWAGAAAILVAIHAGAD
ncbi:MAG: hypothetical protein WA003_16640 [Desulfuromonadaceae bacterium]